MVKGWRFSSTARPITDGSPWNWRRQHGSRRRRGNWRQDGKRRIYGDGWSRGERWCKRSRRHDTRRWNDGKRRRCRNRRQAGNGWHGCSSEQRWCARLRRQCGSWRQRRDRWSSRIWRIAWKRGHARHQPRWRRGQCSHWRYFRIQCDWRHDRHQRGDAGKRRLLLSRGRGPESRLPRARVACICHVGTWSSKKAIGRRCVGGPVRNRADPRSTRLLQLALLIEIWRISISSASPSHICLSARRRGVMASKVGRNCG